MELEIYEAFLSAGVKEDKAKAAVEAINREMDKRQKSQSEQLATHGDIARVERLIAETKVEIIKWSVGTMFAAVGMFAAIVKLFPY